MTNILTPTEGANFVRTDTADAVMLQLLPLVDQYLLNATGHDWAADATIHNTAKIAAGMLLVAWYDNPTQLGVAPETVSSALVQLEAEALKYRKYIFEGSNGGGSLYLPGAREGDTIIKLVDFSGNNQVAHFESAISEDGYIRQVDGNLYDVQMIVVLKYPADEVNA